MLQVGSGNSQTLVLILQSDFQTNSTLNIFFATVDIGLIPEFFVHINAVSIFPDSLV